MSRRNIMYGNCNFTGATLRSLGSRGEGGEVGEAGRQREHGSGQR